MKGGYTNLKNVYWNIKNQPFTEDLSFTKVAEYTLEFLKSLNLADSLISDNTTLKIEDYKITLPKNIMNLRGVRYKTNESDTNGIMLTSSSQIFDDHTCDNIYILKGCELFVQFKDGYLDIAYDLLPLDNEGYPLVPDYGSFPKALAHEISYINAKNLFYLGKIPQQVFQHIAQERDWYVGQAIEQLKTPNYDEANTIANSINRLIVDKNLFEKSFKGMGRKEHLRRGM